MSAHRDASVDALYEQVRMSVPVVEAAAPTVPETVAPGIRVLALRTPTLPPATRTNAYLVGPETGEQLVVDPGSPYPEQQAVLEAALAADAAAGRPLAAVLLTHHHGDHVGGAAVLAAKWGVPIAAHARTAARLAGRIRVERELGDGDAIGGVTCIHTPDHADGHLCFQHGSAIVAGDMVAGIGWILIDPSEGDMGQYLASLRLLLARGAATLLPAHGPPIRDAAGKLNEYISHRLQREEHVARALAGKPGATELELVPDAYADTPRVLWPLAARVLRAHLDKLERDGRARRADRDGQASWFPL